MALQLPNDVWAQVCTYLPIRNVASICRICKRFRAIVLEERFRVSMIRRDLRTLDWLSPEPTLLELDKTIDWRPPAYISVAQIIVCVMRGEGDGTRVVSHTWPCLNEGPLAKFLLQHFVFSPNAQYRTTIVDFACALCFGNPRDFFHKTYSPMLCLMLQSSRTASALLQLAAKAFTIRSVRQSLFLPPQSCTDRNAFAKLLLSRTDSKVIAAQLTLRQWRRLRCISSEMLLGHASGKAREDLAPYVNDFNTFVRFVHPFCSHGLDKVQLINLVQTSMCTWAVVSHQDKDIRKKIWVRFTELYKEIKALRNYETGLALHSTFRGILARSIPKKPSDFDDKVRKEETKWSQSNVHELLCVCHEGKAPYLPPLPYMLTDLTFIFDGNRVKDESNCYNYRRLQLTTEAMMHVLAAQERPYEIVADAEVQRALDEAYTCDATEAMCYNAFKELTRK